VKYVSTRGKAPNLSFEEVLLTGLARDGGLYVPSEIPKFSRGEIMAMRSMTYNQVAGQVIYPFVEGSLTKEDLTDLIEKAYSSFRHEDKVPLKKIADNEWILELFHGPTLAFKDVALQLLGHLFNHVLRKQDKKITIVGATSGDTGSAAIDCVKDRECAEIFMLHPKGRVSDVQRRQMTTVMSENVHNIAVEGDFDDCQAMVKGLFNDLEFRDEITLSAVNSINWARVMSQITYYFTSAVALGAPEKSISYSVPTGNFGDIYAGYMAQQMGLPISQLIVATNQNDILSRVINTGDYTVGEVSPSISPSMDIQISSNFERLLFNIYDGDAAAVRGLMSDLNSAKSFTIADTPLKKAQSIFSALKVDEETTIATIKRVYEETSELIDPHTTVGVHAARELRTDDAIPMVTLSTAHPAKFPEPVAQATGQHPELPEHMADLFEREEKYDILPHNLEVLKQYIKDKIAS
jgi:threonine synthase